MKTMKLALLVASPLLLASCTSSTIPDEPTSSGGAASGGVENPYGKGGGRNNFAVITPLDEQGDTAVVTK